MVWHSRLANALILIPFSSLKRLKSNFQVIGLGIRIGIITSRPHVTISKNTGTFKVHDFESGDD